MQDKDGLQEAIKIFEQLDDLFWEEFTKMIKWRFIGTPPDEEFSSTRANIELLIQKLPCEIAHKNFKQVSGVLLDTIFMVINEQQGEERKLTCDKLEYWLFRSNDASDFGQTVISKYYLLSIGSDDDKWYSTRYDYYKTIDAIDEFRIGEFYEILDLANFCRREKYLHKQKDIWNPYLIYYTRNAQIARDE